MALFDLVGKRILVTGASSGIGRACAILAAELGASVVLTGRRREGLGETLRKMVGQNRHCLVEGDVTEFDFIKRLVEEAGKLDGLVHAAGICPTVPIGMIDVSILLDSVRANYFAFMELMKFYAKRKYAHEGFSSVAISSVAAEAGWAGGALYSGSKGALSAAIRALALELAPKRARVNAVCPGYVKTPLFESQTKSLRNAEEVAKLMSKQPLGVGLPEQVAAPVCFLLSDAASFITGVNLHVDGGYLAM